MSKKPRNSPAKPAATKKREPTSGQLEEALERQVRLLRAACVQYDDGDIEGGAREIAIILRALLLVTPASKPLLKRMGRETQDMFDTALPRFPDDRGPHLGLVGFLSWEGMASLEPLLAGGRGPMSKRPLPDWMKGMVFCDAAERPLTREDLIRHFAIEEVHPGESWDEQYARLLVDHRVGHEFADASGRSRPVTGVAQASLRQMAHETLQSVSAHEPPRGKYIGLFESMTFTNTEPHACLCGSELPHIECHAVPRWEAENEAWQPALIARLDANLKEGLAASAAGDYARAPELALGWAAEAARDPYPLPRFVGQAALALHYATWCSLRLHDDAGALEAADRVIRCIGRRSDPAVAIFGARAVRAGLAARTGHLGFAVREAEVAVALLPRVQVEGCEEMMPVYSTHLTQALVSAGAAEEACAIADIVITRFAASENAHLQHAVASARQVLAENRA